MRHTRASEIASFRVWEGRDAEERDIFGAFAHRRVPPSAPTLGRATVGGEYADLFETTPLDPHEVIAAIDFAGMGFTIGGFILEVLYSDGMARTVVDGSTLFDRLALDDTSRITASGVIEALA